MVDGCLIACIKLEEEWLETIKGNYDLCQMKWLWWNHLKTLLKLLGENLTFGILAIKRMIIMSVCVVCVCACVYMCMRACVCDCVLLVLW